MVAEFFAKWKIKKNEISSIRVAVLESVGVSVLMVGCMSVERCFNGGSSSNSSIQLPSCGGRFQEDRNLPVFPESSIYFLLAAFFGGKKWGPKPVVVSSGDEWRH